MQHSRPWTVSLLSWELALVTAFGTPTPEQAEADVTRTDPLLAAVVSSHRVLQGARVFTDASIYGGDPDAQRGTEISLSVTKGNVSYSSLIRVDVGSLPNKPVKDAALFLQLVGEEHGGPLDLVVYSLQADWDEETVTWNQRHAGIPWKGPGGEYDYNKPVASVMISESFGNNAWLAVRSPQLTHLVNGWIDGSVPNHGLIMRARPGAGPASMKAFASRERHDPAQHPALIVSYDEPIDPDAYGYISDAELVRRPLRLKLNGMTDAANTVPGAKVKLDSLRRKLDKAPVDQAAVADAMESEINQFRMDLTASRWADEPVVVWPCGPWQPLTPDALPVPGPVSLSARLLQEEYQELSVAVTNTTGQPQTLEVELTAAEGSAPYPKEKLTLRGSYWIATREQGYARGEGLPTLVDDALPRLADGRTLALPAGSTRRLWLTVDTNGVGAGNYALVLKLTRSGGKGEVAQVPVTLRVTPISLEKDPEVAVHSYAYLSRPSTRDYLDEAVADLKAHYENTFIFNYLPNPPVDENGIVSGPANYDELRSYIRHLRDARELVFFWHEATAPHFQTTNPWMSPAHKKSLKIWLTEFVRVLREEGFDYDRFMMYPFDESYSNPVHGGRPEMQALAEMADAIREIDPNVRVFANPVTAHPKDDKHYEMLRGKIAAWSMHKSMLDPGDWDHGWPYNFSAADKERLIEGYLRNEQKNGHPVWGFQCEGRTKTKDVNGYYRRWSWQIWHVGFTGIGLWSYNDIRGESGWNDSGDGAGGDFAMVYEMRDAPADIPREPFEALIPARRWQAWRAGIQDYFLLQQVREHRPQLLPALRELSRSILEDPDDPARYERARETLIDYLGS